MNVSRLFLHFTPSGLQKVARRNCASSLVELAVDHAEQLQGPSVIVTTGLLTPAVTPRSSRPAGG